MSECPECGSEILETCWDIEEGVLIECVSDTCDYSDWL